MATTVPEAGIPDQPDLKRVMGPRLLLLFIVGDILGAGIYAVTGDIAGQVGGIAWLPFLVAFAVAGLTALSYLELVTKHPQAAGAALYTHKAFGIHFATFLVAFAVISSGITSASTSARLLGQNLLAGLDGTVGDGGLEALSVPTSEGAGIVVAVLFMVVLALINLRGVGESVKFNVVLTLVEMTALAIVIAIGLWVMARGDADLSRITHFENGSGTSMLLAVTMATAVAFFAMVGFEDSVNMAEETQDPQRTFPRALLLGLASPSSSTSWSRSPSCRSCRSTRSPMPRRPRRACCCQRSGWARRVSRSPRSSRSSPSSPSPTPRSSTC